MGDAQVAVLLAVVPAADADDVALLHGAAVGVRLRPEEARASAAARRLRLRAREDRAVARRRALAPQLVAGVDHVLRRAVGEELLVGVVAQDRLKALEQVVVLAPSRPKQTARAGARQVRGATSHSARSPAPARGPDRPRAGAA